LLPPFLNFFCTPQRKRHFSSISSRGQRFYITYQYRELCSFDFLLPFHIKHNWRRRYISIIRTQDVSNKSTTYRKHLYVLTSKRQVILSLLHLHGAANVHSTYSNALLQQPKKAKIPWYLHINLFRGTAIFQFFSFAEVSWYVSLSLKFVAHLYWWNMQKKNCTREISKPRNFGWKKYSPSDTEFKNSIFSIISLDLI
jgi:hypothetical protein